MIIKLLEQYMNEKDYEKRRIIENEIWNTYGTEGAVAIWDMSNFTKLTQEKGIVYFLSLIEKMQRGCIPIIKKHNGTFVKMLADDIFAKFETLKDAVDCANEVKEWYETQQDIELACGISYGKFLEIKDENGVLLNIFGDPVNKAFRLGEDTAKGGEILIDEKLFGDK